MIDLTNERYHTLKQAGLLKKMVRIFIYIRHCCTLKLSLHDIYRDDVPGSKRADRRCGGGDVFQMRTIDFKQNRDR